MSTELAHVGVKGMKWGVRKDRRSGATRGSSKPPPAKGSKKPNPAKKVKVDAAENSSALKKGAQTAGKVLKTTGKVSLIALGVMQATAIGGLWMEWGYSPADWVQNKPIFEDM